MDINSAETGPTMINHNDQSYHHPTPNDDTTRRKDKQIKRT